MQHTLVAVFEDRTDAQHAMSALISAGFPREDVQLSNADPTGMTDSTTGGGHGAAPDGGVMAGSIANLRRVFTDLFGADNSAHASKYVGAVTRGHHVLTVRAHSLDGAERAADIVERFGPTDIDEQASGAGPMEMGATVPSDDFRASGAGSMQQASAAPAQPRPGSASRASLHLDNPGNRGFFQQHSLNQSEPTGGTYQEPLGSSGLGATGSTSLHGSILRDNAAHVPSLEDSLIEIQRGGSRIYAAQAPLSTGPSSGLHIGSNFFGDDDDSYRNHFLANYGDDDAASSRSGAGMDYDSLKPAYAFGAEMGRSALYRNRPWDDVEGDLARVWHARAATGSGLGAAMHGAWDRMKAAVRHGWERMSSHSSTDDRP